MIRRATTIGILAAALAVTSARTGVDYSRIVASAQNFQKCFRDLGRTERALSPVDRVMLSLILADSRTGHAAAQAGSGHRGS